MSSARVILELLIKRLEARIGPDDEKLVRGYWGEEPPEEFRKAMLQGKRHFQQALHMARAALKSGDETQILTAALHCPPFERLGLEKALTYAENELRKKGGAIRGEQQRTRAREQAHEWIEIYEAQLAKGNPPAIAFNEVSKAMDRRWEGDPPLDKNKKPIPRPANGTVRRWIRQRNSCSPA